MQFVNKIQPVNVILQRTKNYQNFLQKLRPEDSFQALLCLQRIKHDLYSIMKSLKQATYIRCNSKTIKICPNQHADLFRFLFKEDSLKIKKDLELVSSPHFT